MERQDCFAYDGERCKVLSVMICQHKECPFGKTKEQFDADLKKYPPTDKYTGCKVW